MATTYSVATLVGSLRQESLNRKMAHALAALAPPSLTLKVVEIGALPHYNPDLETAPPAPWVEFRQAIDAAQAVLFVTPEYNRSFPGVLKNAIDVASRPYGQNKWQGKPGAVVSVSPGAVGGFGANHHLRQSLVFVDVPTMTQPEAYVGGADKLFDAQGAIAVDGKRQFFTKFMQAFARWIETNARR